MPGSYRERYEASGFCLVLCSLRGSDIKKLSDRDARSRVTEPLQNGKLLVHLLSRRADNTGKKFLQARRGLDIILAMAILLESTKEL